MCILSLCEKDGERKREREAGYSKYVASPIALWRIVGGESVAKK